MLLFLYVAAADAVLGFFPPVLKLQQASHFVLPGDKCAVKSGVINSSKSNTRQPSKMQP